MAGGMSAREERQREKKNGSFYNSNLQLHKRKEYFCFTKRIKYHSQYPRFVLAFGAEWDTTYSTDKRPRSTVTRCTNDPEINSAAQGNEGLWCCYPYTPSRQAAPDTRNPREVKRGRKRYAVRGLFVSKITYLSKALRKVETEGMDVKGELLLYREKEDLITSFGYFSSVKWIWGSKSYD